MRRTVTIDLNSDCNFMTSDDFLRRIKNAFREYEIGLIEHVSCKPEEIKIAASKQAHQSILKEADELVNKERPSNYGPITESFDAIGRVLDEILTKEERQSIIAGVTSGSVIIKAHIATKLVRNSYSPENRDHRVDIAGYTEILDQYYSEKKK